MNRPHVTQPQLCADCLPIAHAWAETGKPTDRVIKRCGHGADGVVIAVAAKIDGRIVNWHLEGPLSDEQADIVGEKILLQFLASGAEVRDVVKQ